MEGKKGIRGARANIPVGMASPCVVGDELEGTTGRRDSCGHSRCIANPEELVGLVTRNRNVFEEHEYYMVEVLLVSQ